MTTNGDESNRGSVVLISTDPRVPHLLDRGYVTVSESWGAHIRSIDDGLKERLSSHVSRLQSTGLAITVLGSDSDSEIETFDQATGQDYPVSAATPHKVLDGAEMRRLRARGFIFFGVVDGETLAALTAIAVVDGVADTQLTAVKRAYRGRGLATAIKAASMLDAISRGATSFATGGAASNAASLKMNEKCGYLVDERWLTLESPT